MAVLPLTVIIGLSIAGFVYATWTDSLSIVGTVNMGDLQVVFSYEEPAYCKEVYWDPDLLVFVDGEYLGKPVGEQTFEPDLDSEVWNKAGDKHGYTKMIFTITSAYPSYIVQLHYFVHNIGSVVGYFNGFDISGSYMEDAIEYQLEYRKPSVEPNVGPVDFWEGDLWEDKLGGDPIINVHTTNDLGHQIDPCTSFKGEVDFHFKQTAKECHTYTIEIVLNWANKYPAD